MIRMVLAVFAAALGVIALVLYWGDDPAPAPQVTRAESQPLFTGDPSAAAAALRDTAQLLAKMPVADMPAVEPRLAPLDLADGPSFVDPIPQTNGALRSALVRALTAGRPDADIRDLLARAATVPGLDLPESIAIAGGVVDLRPLLPGAPESAAPVALELVAREEEPDAPEPLAPIAPRQTAAPQPEDDAPALAAPAATATPETYVVRPGDSLSSIAEAHYGDPDAYTRIVAANRARLGDVEVLHVGLELVLPE
ncbi:hypothetical protein OG2516_12291 [Oceanicola granulosus HTCC2516]|uniref:LysM domain-containing protein n=1 Tax=Oceanicola granulosus (strain ATCC BAA-861 / DSM 15982 / KCTC 12143 / HTCC2516) TaxID=314256 RepID=Q2CD50_OCEGH|nr:hypothetical protein OG2516_12291 [Oceanicola granulosus HTCC2516]